MRRASLVLSVMLIVAITVGYVARRSTIVNERDLRLSSAVEVASARMAALVDAVEIAANTGVDPVDTAQAFATTNPLMGVCAVAESATSCAGDGPRPDADVLTARADAATGDDPAIVQVYDSLMSVAVQGPALLVVVQAPVDVFSVRGGVSVWITTLLPESSSADRFVVSDGLRQYATLIEPGDGVFVVATTDNSVSLPSDEARFYALILSLAVVLLGLAGVTLFVEQRNLVERASFDPLTKLPNRSEFERCAADAIADAERDETGLSLLLFDLNGFKMVNDTYGHQAGDEMLKVIGSRLRKAVRDDDVVARWGGDEFVVVMPGVTDPDMASRRAEQLAAQVAGRTRIDGVSDSLRVKVSVGVAMWPAHGADLRALVEAADKAMYQAKREGATWRLADAARPPLGVG